MSNFLFIVKIHEEGMEAEDEFVSYYFIFFWDQVFYKGRKGQQWPAQH